MWKLKAFIYLLIINFTFNESKLVYAFINEDKERDKREYKN